MDAPGGARMSVAPAVDGLDFAGDIEWHLAALRSRSRSTPDFEPVCPVAVLLPCRNEAATIAKVVTDFRSALPTADIFVYDNGSVDGTEKVALAAGAKVRHAPQRGKGNVLRRMFADIDAGVYVVADGDDTYDAAAAPVLIRTLIEERLDMVIGTRVAADGRGAAYRSGHRVGNRVLTRVVHWLFSDGSDDILSGYRVLSRRYVKSFPAFAAGFETEAEMTVHALDLCLPFGEVRTTYGCRPVASTSKLRTVRDGLSIAKLIVLLCKDYRPLRFFGWIATMATMVSILAAIGAHGHLHSWTPNTFAAAAAGVLAVLSLFAGVILDSLRRGRREIKRMLYLAVPTAPAVGPWIVD